MGKPASLGVPELVALLKEEIRARGPLTFARFMDAALNEPGLGYYASHAGRIGPGGDYVTAAASGGLFAECLARQMSEMDGILANPDPFRYVECASGSGILTRDLLDALARENPDLLRRSRVRMVDLSEAMRAESKVLVPEGEVFDRAPRCDGEGLVVAIELLDALPVHRIRRTGASLREVFVDLDATGGFIEVEAEPTPEARGLAERYGAAPDAGDEAEVCPAIGVELERVAGAIGRGFIVLADYGGDASDLYDRSRRRGTLLAYHRHRTNEDYLARVGEQDLTAHVNWSHVADCARELGLTVLGSTTQDRFLIGNGLLRAFEDENPGDWHRADRVRARLQAKQLLHPDGMGRAFRFVVLAKGLDSTPSLAGLADPFR